MTRRTFFVKNKQNVNSVVTMLIMNVVLFKVTKMVKLMMSLQIRLVFFVLKCKKWNLTSVKWPVTFLMQWKRFVNVINKKCKQIIQKIAYFYFIWHYVCRKCSISNKEWLKKGSFHVQMMQKGKQYKNWNIYFFYLAQSFNLNEVIIYLDSLFGVLCLH